MPTVHEGNLCFDFPNRWIASPYDTWAFYRKQFIGVGVRGRRGIKAVDILALDPGKTAWLIEVKDFRQNRRTRPEDLADEVAKKVFDTLAALLPASVRANDIAERVVASDILKAVNLRVVLHLEQSQQSSRLFPRDFDPSRIQMKLRQIIKPIDPHAVVVETGNMHSLQWRVS